MPSAPSFIDGRLHERELYSRARTRRPLATRRTPDVYYLEHDRKYPVDPARYTRLIARRTTVQNLFTRSGNLADAAWTKSELTATANVRANPFDGVVAMARLLETTANANHAVSQAATVAATPTFMAVVAEGGLGRDYLRVLYNDSAAANFYAMFNIARGVVVTTSGCTASVQPIPGSAAFRLRIFFTPAAGAGTGYCHLSNDGSTTSYTGDAAKGVYLTAAQISAGSTALPYIPTAASAVTAGSAPDVDTTDPFAFLVLESDPAEYGPNRAIVARTFARIPGPQVRYDKRAFARPPMHDIKSGSTYAVSFDNMETSWLFSSRLTVGSVDALAAQTKAVAGTVTRAGTNPYNLPAATVDTWEVIPVTIQGAVAQIFFTSTDYLGIRNACQAGTGLTVSVLKSNTEIVINVTGGTLVGVQCTDNRVEVVASGIGAANATVTIRRRQTSARTEGTQTKSETDTPSITETYAVPQSIRVINSDSHGGAAGDLVALWNGDKLVATSRVISVGANSFTIPLDDLPGKDAVVTHCQFAKNGTRYVNGTKPCDIRITETAYLPGVSTGITTEADIPSATLYLDPIAWLGRIVAAATFVAIDEGTVDHIGPMVWKRVEEVEMADALETRTASA